MPARSRFNKNNIMERFYDLSFSRQPDGSIRLMQSDCGEDYILDMHQEQLLYIARQLCGMKPETANQVADLERRIAVLVDKLQRVVCDDYFRKDLLNECGDGLEYVAKLDAVLDLALEFDGGRLEPEYRENAANSSATVSKPKANPSEIHGLLDEATSRQVTTGHAPSRPAGQQLGLEGVR